MKKIRGKKGGISWQMLTKIFYRYSTEFYLTHWISAITKYWSGNLAQHLSCSHTINYMIKGGSKWPTLNFVMRWLLVVYVLHYRKNWILILLLLDKFEFPVEIQAQPT